MYRTIHADCRHFGWDNQLPPVAEIGPGETLEFDVNDASGGRITPASTHADIELLDPGAANPVTGPVRIEGAMPGDTLWVEIVDVGLSGWGWTGIIPGFGLLAGDFSEPYLNLSSHDPQWIEFAPGLRIPTRPFPGTIGVAPAASGRHAAIPPRNVGGNLDMKHLGRGARLGLPVAVPGALFSVGDTHAAQGDGEICGTAIETPMRLTLRFTLEKSTGLVMPRAELPAGRSAAGDGACSVTMGVGPDLFEAARVAVRDLVDLTMRRHGLSAELAYCLCSVAADLSISEIVNEPNWVVSARLPTGVFD